MAQKSENEQAKDQMNADFIFDNQGNVHRNFVPRATLVGTNINTNCVLHQVNVPYHTTFSVNHFLAGNNIPVAPQFLYTFNLSPYDFFLLP